MREPSSGALWAGAGVAILILAVTWFWQWQESRSCASSGGIYAKVWASGSWKGYRCVRISPSESTP